MCVYSVCVYVRDRECVLAGWCVDEWVWVCMCERDTVCVYVVGVCERERECVCVSTVLLRRLVSGCVGVGVDVGERVCVCIYERRVCVVVAFLCGLVCVAGVCGCVGVGVWVKEIASKRVSRE